MNSLLFIAGNFQAALSDPNKHVSHNFPQTF